MIDVHCHLQFNAFEKDFKQVIDEAFSEGISTIINTGTQLSSSQKAVEFADAYENLYAIVGVHPHHADKIQHNPYVVEQGENSSINNVIARRNDEAISSNTRLPRSARNDENFWLKELENLTHHPKVLAIGEIGMDYFSYKSNGIVDQKLQREVFEAQIELAHRTKLPLQIHNRHAGEDVIEILKHHKNVLQSQPGMFHCFAGNKAFLKAALDMGFFIGFDGNITYKGLAPGETVELQELAQMTPLDRIVIETDAPYLTPAPHRGKRNEPKYAILTAQFIAALKGISFEKLVEQTDKNVYTMFRKIKNKSQR